MMNKLQLLCGVYGDYELVQATNETIEKYFENCLESITADEMYETWLLYHTSVQDVLFKVLEQVEQGQGEVFFLLFHDPFDGVKVVGIGGVNPLGDISAMAGEIWFMGESLARHKRFLVRYGRNILRDILEQYPVLLNIAAAWNTRAFHLAVFMGFCVEKEHVRIGMGKTLFKRFYLTRQAFTELLSNKEHKRKQKNKEYVCVHQQ